MVEGSSCKVQDPGFQTLEDGQQPVAAQINLSEGRHVHHPQGHGHEAAIAEQKDLAIDAVSVPPPSR